MYFTHIKIQCQCRLSLSRMQHDFMGDERIAVAIAAYPAADAKKRRNIWRIHAHPTFQQILHFRIQARYLGEKSIVIIGETIIDFVVNRETRRTQDAGLP